jgi:hypothetical protein
MTRRDVHRPLLPLTAALAIVAAMRWRSSVTLDPPRAVAAPAIPREHTIITDSALADAESTTVDNDPFRLSNEPPDAAYDPAREGTASGSRGSPPPRTRPNLVLRAIVGGPPWQAVIDGIPAQPPGTLARSGSTFDGFVVRAVFRDSVVVQLPDTTVVLGFGRRP